VNFGTLVIHASIATCVGRAWAINTKLGVRIL